MVDKKKKKRAFIANVQVGSVGMDLDSIRTLAENDPQGFMRFSQEKIDSGEFSWENVRDLRGLFHALADVQVNANIDVLGKTKAIQASAFPLLAGSLTIAGINEAYEAVPTIGQDLVTEMTDNKRVTILAGITSLNPKVDRVEEGHDFPEIGAGEEKFDIRSKRNGRRLSITAEMIEENDVAGIVQRVDALGEIAAETVENQTLSRVCDFFGSGGTPVEPYVLHLNDVALQLYNHNANTPGTRAPSGTRVRNNSLTDESDLEAARRVLAAMQNSRGERIGIPVSSMVLLVPDALHGQAFKILGSEMVSGVLNELSDWGPRGSHRPKLISSPKLDDISTTAWYLGNFKKQFKRKWKLVFEYVTLSGNIQAFLQSRIAFQARIAWDVEVGAVDYAYCVQNLSSTSAPS